MAEPPRPPVVIPLVKARRPTLGERAQPLVAVVLLAGLVAAAAALARWTGRGSGPDLGEITQARPGDRRELSADAVRGKLTLVMLYSERCEPSRAMGPALERVARARSDLAVRKIDIDRTSAKTIDFDSPLAKQYAVHVTPYFLIFDAQGALLARGDEAKDRLRDWFLEAQLEDVERQAPELGEPYRSP